MSGCCGDCAQPQPAGSGFLRPVGSAAVTIVCDADMDVGLDADCLCAAVNLQASRADPSPLALPSL